jgi:hypothetical protein
MDRYCFICGRTTDLVRHHIYPGTAMRKVSEKYGAVADLCVDCHTGPNGVHQNTEMKKFLQRTWQAKFEEEHGRDEFVRIFGGYVQ